MYFNPYSGEIIQNEIYLESRAMRLNLFLRAGHRFFWLPPKIGSPIVGVSCIVFLITLVTGLLWWYPRKWTKTTRAKSFKIKWKAGWKRVNIDLHNVLGFYALIVVTILTITGIYYSFDWFKDSYRYLLTGKKHTMANHVQTSHQEINEDKVDNKTLDKVWHLFAAGKDSEWETLSLSWPNENTNLITMAVNTNSHSTYTSVRHFYDPITGTEVNNDRTSRAGLKSMSMGEKIYAMNFDIHVGAIGGLSTKVLASLASLIGASLPLTGFIIWYNRKWGKKRKNSKYAKAKFYTV
jgi:uncharacterized iron-regulated membrane protein